MYLIKKLFIIILFVNNVFSQNFFYYPQQQHQQKQQQYLQQQQFQNLNSLPQQQFYLQFRQQQPQPQPQQYFLQYYPPQQQQKIRYNNVPNNINNVQPVIFINQQQKKIQQPQHRQTTATVVPTETFNLQPKRTTSNNLAKYKNSLTDKLEFDLPPPPPSQFLPDFELDKIKISELILQQHKQQTKIKPEIQSQKNQIQQNLVLQKQTISNQQLKQIEQQRRNQMLLQKQQKQLLLQQQNQKQSIQQLQEKKPSIKTDSENTQPTRSFLSSKKNEPNKIFLNCCKKKNVDKVCESRCSFDKINKKILTQMFLGSDPCPQKYGLDLFSCAAHDSDHTECCKSKQVQRTAAGDKCLAFCNLSPDSQFQADASYLPCWGVLNDVKNCFKESIVRKYAS